jgi:phospholipase/lecithinase/hemolysin
MFLAAWRADGCPEPVGAETVAQPNAVPRALGMLLIPSFLWLLLRQTATVQALVRLMVLVWLGDLAVCPAQAAFSSLYAFGDGVCTTSDNVDWNPYWYPKSYSNGRIWIQVLAQRQGLTYEETKNLSYFGHGSANLVADVAGFSAADASTSLFVVWVNDADFANYMLDTYPTYGLDPTKWNSMVSSSLVNHQTAIQTLYAKGARTLMMPNAVDIGEIPQYSGLTAAEKSFVRQGITAFNNNFATLLAQATAASPGLKIYMPNMFTLLDDMVARPGSYGLINASGGLYAIQDGYSTWNGPRNNWLWWDAWDPTAKAHEIMADVAQQLVSPVMIGRCLSLSGSNRLDLANVPIGLNGFVDTRTNLALGSWAQTTNFDSISATQTIFVPASGLQRFYRLRFPFAWSWP